MLVNWWNKNRISVVVFIGHCRCLSSLLLACILFCWLVFRFAMHTTIVFDFVQIDKSESITVCTRKLWIPLIYAHIHALPPYNAHIGPKLIQTIFFREHHLNFWDKSIVLEYLRSDVWNMLFSYTAWLWSTVFIDLIRYTYLKRINRKEFWNCMLFLMELKIVSSFQFAIHLYW